MMPDLVNMAGIELLDPLEQPQRVEVARARPHRRDRAAARSRDCGCRRRAGPSTTVSTAPALRRKSGVSTSIVVAGRGRADRPMQRDEMAGAAVRQIVAVDRGDDDVLEAELARPPRRHARARADRAGRGRPVVTLQKAQARVQTSPRIITVACFCVQHSPMFGQAASSHTVCRLQPRIRRAGLVIAARDRRLDPDPGRLARTPAPVAVG